MTTWAESKTIIPFDVAPRSAARILVCHPGHDHSTCDVYDGICEGLRLNGIEVVPFEWQRSLRLMNTLTLGAQAGGFVEPTKADVLQGFGTWLASADAINLALDQEVSAVIVINGLLFPPSRAQVMQKLGIPIACYGTEAPYFLSIEQEIAAFYTHWFTNERRCVKDFPNGHYLPHAYNPAKHRPGAKDASKQVDAVFIGGGFPERQELLRGQGVTTRGTLWHLDMDAEVGATDSQRNTRYSEGAIDNDETSAWHRSAKIALNLHRKMTQVETGGQIAPGSAESLGPRAYEIPAVGGFELLDDERPEVWEVFGDSAATFKAWDRADLRRQLDYWMTHDDAREAQQRAQAEAIQPHHWGNRARQLLERLLT